MTLSINLTNSYQDRHLIKPVVTQGIDKGKVDSKVSKSLPKDCTNFANIAQSQVQPLGKETLLSLQELQESTLELFNPQKAEIVTLQKEPVIDDTPRLNWLIGRDNEMYESYVGCLSRGAESMSRFSEIVSRTKDSPFISRKDMITLQGSINRFQGGYNSQQKAKEATNDLIVHRVIDYIMPKTQARLQLIKDYLASKELNPVEVAEEKEREARIDSLFNRIDSLFTDKSPEDKPDMILEISHSKVTHPIDFKSNDITEKLLEFLAKDSKWYEWYLRDDSSEPCEIIEYRKSQTKAS